eukprot:gb/GECH01002938.1/.p1 GENE.gb/GECH01002938.1/~~gb/GECH01002938.1/.p1  ORF type:complete len:994 (+),score=266.63 gb/GECH01002938.1/:1-2982(+)
MLGRLNIKPQSAVASRRTPSKSSNQLQKTTRNYAKSTLPTAFDPSESFLSGTSSAVLEDLYEQWKSNPAAVDQSLAHFFKDLDKNTEAHPPTYKRPLYTSVADMARQLSSGSEVDSEVMYSVRTLLMIRAYRVRGHLLAKLDPLGLQEREPHPELDPETYGFTEQDMNKEVRIGSGLWLDGILEDYRTIKLGEIIQKLKEVYCGSIGAEFYHIHDPHERDWLTEKMESRQTMPAEGQKNVYENLAKAELFENFLQRKYTSAKRFGLEGGESLIPSLEVILSEAGQRGIEDIVIGMPHRGRLNVLGNFVKKPLRAIFSEFQDDTGTDDFNVLGSGDVKYHLGTSTDRVLEDGSEIHLSLTANPSHLEAVNPVVEGKTRAKQHFKHDSDRTKVMSLLMHGDAAFSGQGIVAETLGFQDLKGYTTGGTIHIIVNNQIGFTTDPHSARSSPYPSDVAKMVGAPIFHVNGDDPVAVAWVSQLAVEFRQKFHKDVVIDIICYRRYGHNELDEPSFTQPKMYNQIHNHPSTLSIYEKYVTENNIISEEECTKIKDKINKNLEEEFQASKGYKSHDTEWLEKNWQGWKSKGMEAKNITYVSADKLKDIGMKITGFPEGLSPHRGVSRVYKQRRRMIENGKGIDWGMGEALAYATLLEDGYSVRLSGQDSERGTFSHRHSIIHDQKDTSRKYVPLQNVSENQGIFKAANSHLSEAGVLGFEMGYSLEHPDLLVLWEAQFGDFCNGAQVIIDQFVSSGEAKWLRQSGLTMLLPHGYDGQGPEHSSCRIERYLQNVDEDATKFTNDSKKQERDINYAVVNVTTPANFFHVLRRQVCREFRKPLIVASPKKLLRHKWCQSDLEEFAEGSEFRRIIPDTHELVADDKVKRIIFCSGQIFTDLWEHRMKSEINDVAVIRVEELAPFPFDLIKQTTEKYKNADIMWCQEEPQNMGAWWYVFPRFITATGRTPQYSGRGPAASPATGFKSVHNHEQKQLLSNAFNVSDK